MFPQLRMRRLRRTSKIRDIVRETVLNPNDFVYPVFVKEGADILEPIDAMPGQFRLPLRNIVEEGKTLVSLSIPAVMLFGIPSNKDDVGSSAYAKDGIVQRAVRSVRSELESELVIITDVCLCQYTSHGHCGVVEKGEIVNDASLEIIKRVAVSHAEAGADIVAPSGMMDGQVRVIREELDRTGFPNVGIMAYSAKHASCFYSPFREAAYSSPSSGDRMSYQMDFGSPNQAIREVGLDIEEGADIVMIKPALPYLDLINRVKVKYRLPTAAYSVSGEYSMIKAAAEKGWIDEKAAMLEILTAIKRAGADMIITYFAKDISKCLMEK